MKLKIDATDITAWLIIIGCIVLMAAHIDGEVKSILTMAAGWAVRKPITNGASSTARVVKKKISRTKTSG